MVCIKNAKHLLFISCFGFFCCFCFILLGDGERIPFAPKMRSGNCRYCQYTQFVFVLKWRELHSFLLHNRNGNECEMSCQILFVFRKKKKIVSNIHILFFFMSLRVPTAYYGRCCRRCWTLDFRDDIQTNMENVCKNCQWHLMKAVMNQCYSSWGEWKLLSFDISIYSDSNGSRSGLGGKFN